MGKSSGGFGAMITPMLRPDLFGALATHAGDSLYELCYVPEFGKDVRHLREYGGDIWRWWDDFRSRTSFTREADMDLLGLLGVAACFSAEPDGTVELPFDPCTAALREAGVPDGVIHFELFEAGHMGIDYRYPLSLAWLCQRIAP